MNLSKRLAFGVVYALVLTVATLAGTEFFASYFAPPWPAQALRAVPPANPVKVLPEAFANQPWLAETYNSWGMRDSERTVAKPPGVDFRSVFVGDSFVEALFTPLSLPAAVERRLAGSRPTIETVSLGISATGPRSYYYRLRDVALKLSPDAVLLFFFAGNDFISASEGNSAYALPPLFSESPGGSLLGGLMPRTNWLVVNRLRLAESLQGSEPPPNEESTLYDIVHGPPAERLRRLVAHIRKYHQPELSEATISEVLSRGGGRFWNDIEKQDGEKEILFGWNIPQLLSWEAATFDVATSRQDAARIRQAGMIEATLSWLVAANRLAQERRVPLKIFLVPVASLDPDYVEFWKPWPRAFSWNYLCEDREFELAAALRAAGVPFISLREDLAGISGTYRKRDGHWTQKGEAIVADRVARELRSMIDR